MTVLVRSWIASCIIFGCIWWALYTVLLTVQCRLQWKHTRKTLLEMHHLKVPKRQNPHRFLQRQRSQSHTLVGACLLIMSQLSSASVHDFAAAPHYSACWFWLYSTSNNICCRDSLPQHCLNIVLPVPELPHNTSPNQGIKKGLSLVWRSVMWQTWDRYNCLFIHPTHSSIWCSFHPAIYPSIHLHHPLVLEWTWLSILHLYLDFAFAST